MLSEEDLYQKVHAWIGKLPRKLRCPACDDHTWELRYTDRTATKVPDVITIMCRCCGHLSFFDAQMIGIRDDEREASKTAP